MGSDVKSIPGDLLRESVTIRAASAYVWVTESKTTVRGNWRKMARQRTEVRDRGARHSFTKGEVGKDWDLWRSGVNPGKNAMPSKLSGWAWVYPNQGTRLP